MMFKVVNKTNIAKQTKQQSLYGIRCFVVLFSLLLSSITVAKGQYVTLPQALERTFSEKLSPSHLWLNKQQKKAAAQILQHKYSKARVKYWQKGDKRLWVINEIGKELPITFLVVTEAGVIQDIDVMKFRESRGDEIRMKVFRQQFDQAQLSSDHKLSRHIDGISGATYSVRAMKKVARLALLFDQWLNTKTDGQTVTQQ